MAVNNAQVNVTTTAQRLDPTKPGQMMPRGSLVICNRGANPVWIGNKDVTSANGFQIDANGIFSADLGSGDALYAVSVIDNVRVDILQVGGAA